MDGALCMELLTSEGWNPVNDIESVIVSIRSLIVVGDGRISAAERLRGEPDGYSTTIHKKSDAQIPPAAVLPGKTLHDAIEKISNTDHHLHPEANILHAPHHAVAAAAIKENHDDAQMKEVMRESLLKEEQSKKRPFSSIDVGRYTEAESRAAYSHLSEYHKKKGWSRWWARKG
jgi:ubiquitin-conjugating enzyme E2 Q